MINLTQDTNDSFSEYKAAVDRKNDDSIEKNELLSIEKPMEDCYINYKQHFDSNNLENLNAARVGQQHKDTLLGYTVLMLQLSKISESAISHKTHKRITIFAHIAH